MNKRGNVIDIMFAVVILFAIAISLISVTKVFSDITISINGSSGFNQVTKDNLNQHSNSLPKVLNGTFVLVFFGAFLAIAISAYLIQSSAIFFMVAVFILTVFTFISAVLSNVYFDYIASDAATEAYVLQNFAMLNHLINNYVLYVVILGFVVIMALYAKTTSNVGSGI
jgi:hypothetical protein